MQYESIFPARFLARPNRFPALCRVEDGAAMRKVLVALCMKYLPEHKDKIGEGIAREIDDTAIWAVDLEEVRGKGARRLGR